MLRNPGHHPGSAFAAVGAWESSLSHRCVPYDAMQVWDSVGSGFMRFKAPSQQEPLGWLVEEKVLKANLGDAVSQLAKEQGRLSLLAPNSVQHLELPPAASSPRPYGATQRSTPGQHAVVELEGGEELITKLVVSCLHGTCTNAPKVAVRVACGKAPLARALPLQVGADGANSPTRAAAGIGVWGWDYDQRGLVATIKTAEPHTTAWQRFLPTGPLAILPLWDDMSSIVWSAPPDLTRKLAAMPESEFLEELNRALGHESALPFQHSFTANPISEAHAASSSLEGAFGIPRSINHLGPLWGGIAAAADAFSGTLVAASSSVDGFHAPPIAKGLKSARASFPLRLQGARSQAGPRCALVGDAAHTMHPMAGQNLNMGIADCTQLAASLAAGASAGRELGSAVTLSDFSTARQMGNTASMLAVDVIKRMYAVPASPLSWLRNVGMAGINALPPVKTAIAQLAAGKDGQAALDALLQAAPHLQAGRQAVQAAHHALRPRLRQASKAVASAGDVAQQVTKVACRTFQDATPEPSSGPNRP